MSGNLDIGICNALFLFLPF